MTEQPPPDEAQDSTEELDAPQPHRPLPPAAAAPAPGPAAGSPAAFPQVLKTPWVNPARRNQVTLVSVLALLVVAAAAFIAGLAVGDDHGDRGRGGVGVVCPMDGMGPYQARHPMLCMNTRCDAGKHGWCPAGINPRFPRVPAPATPTNPSEPAPSASSSSSK